MIDVELHIDYMQSNYMDASKRNFKSHINICMHTNSYVCSVAIY